MTFNIVVVAFALVNACVSSYQFLFYGAQGLRVDYSVSRHLWYALRATFDWGICAALLSVEV